MRSPGSGTRGDRGDTAGDSRDRDRDRDGGGEERRGWGRDRGDWDGDRTGEDGGTGLGPGQRGWQDRGDRGGRTEGTRVVAEGAGGPGEQDGSPGEGNLLSPGFPGTAPSHPGSLPDPQCPHPWGQDPGPFRGLQGVCKAPSAAPLPSPPLSRQSRAGALRAHPKERGPCRGVPPGPPGVPGRSPLHGSGWSPGLRDNKPCPGRLGRARNVPGRLLPAGNPRERPWGHRPGLFLGPHGAGPCPRA